ncbi:MAG: hypothetical protein WKF70_09160 [Chitinophagaceae bacterium]
MSTKTKEQAPACTHTSKMLENSRSYFPARPSDMYIIISPAFFDEVLKPKLYHIDSIELRQPGQTYKKLPEDLWMTKPNCGEFTADVWQNKYHNEKIIFVQHQGKLFCCENVIEAAEIIDDIKKQEAAKVIKS